MDYNINLQTIKNQKKLENNTNPPKTKILHEIKNLKKQNEHIDNASGNR